MRFHVLGLGPLGSLIAHHLRRALAPSHPITLLYSKPSFLRRAPNALHVETAGTVSTASGFVYETFEIPATAEESSPGPIESLLVTTRPPQTLHAVRRLLPRLSPSSTIVLVQNGLGVYEQLVQNLFRNPHERPHFIFATSTHTTSFPSASALYAGRPTLLQSTVGDIEFSVAPDPNGRKFESGLFDETVHVAERRPRLSDIAVPEGDPLFHRYRSLRNTVAALLLAEPLNARWKSMAHVQLALRRQLAVRSVIHPLTALMGCRNGDLFSTPAATRLAARLCQETSDVYRAQIRDEAEAWLADNEGHSGSLLGFARLPRVLETESLTRECLSTAQIAPKTISTMLAAVRHGHRTEVDHLNGYLVRLGKTYGVEVPTHAAIYNLVRMRSAVPQVLDKIF